MNKIEAADLLEQGAELIREHGHCQNEYWPGAAVRVSYPSGAPMCVLGSLYAAEGIVANGVLSDRLADVMDVLNLRLTSSIPDWNDQPERTADEVVDMMLSTAKDLRNEA